MGWHEIGAGRAGEYIISGQRFARKIIQFELTAICLKGYQPERGRRPQVAWGRGRRVKGKQPWGWGQWGRDDEKWDGDEGEGCSEQVEG